MPFFQSNGGNVPVAKKFTASSRLTMVLMTKILHPYPIANSQKIELYFAYPEDPLEVVPFFVCKL